jgi:cephalosporin hydroxylase
MNEIEKFQEECRQNIEKQGRNQPLLNATSVFLKETIDSRYSYNFTWMGRPIIQYPQDMVIMQELIWSIKPDLIIETGIAHGGSLIFYASIMELIGKGEVLGIDIDIREHNKKEILSHPMSKRITMLQGSSIDPLIVEQVRKIADGKPTVMVLLDSNHSHDHVLNELKVYADLTSVGSYCVVFDTVVEDLPKGIYSADRPWDVGSNPKTAVFEFLKNNSDFVIDKSIDYKILLSVAPDGYLKRIK